MGTLYEVSNAGVVKTDTIDEKTLNAGVTIDNVLVKDGLVDGLDISTLPPELANLTTAEVNQLANIDVTTISTTQWGYVGGADQAVKTTDAVTFATVNTGQGANELYAMDQNVRTTDAVTFATVNTGQGANELYAMDQAVQTTDSVTFGSTYVGSASIDSTAILQADSTTKGFLPPRMTTTQRDAIVTPATGLMIYNSTTNQWEGYNGTSWVILG